MGTTGSFKLSLYGLFAFPQDLNFLNFSESENSENVLNVTEFFAPCICLIPCSLCKPVSGQVHFI